MKILIKFISIIGFVSMSQVAVAIDNVEDGDVLTADTMNEIIDATNDNTADSGLDFDIECIPKYAVGDPGAAGGIVFFVTSDGCNGLEAWTADEGITLSWGCIATEVGAGGTAIGEGAPNTLAIVNAGCTVSGAAGATRAASYGGQTDWYLPSQGELIEMYNTIGPGGTNVGGFTDGIYWSSSETTSASALAFDFLTGSRAGGLKNIEWNVRAIRTINQP